MEVKLQTGVRIIGDRVTIMIAGRSSSVIVPGLTRLGVKPTDNTTWHYYDPSEGVAPSGRYGVSRATIWRNLLEEPYPVFPFARSTPVEESSNVVPLGRVRHVVDRLQYVIFNVTAPGHWLHPGLVIRALSEVGGQWVITTIGCGNGPLRLANLLMANIVWGQNARRIGRESIFEESRAKRGQRGR